MRGTLPNGLTSVGKVLCLEKVDVFKYATTEMLAYIGFIALELHLRKGEVVFAEDGVSDAMYVVLSGSVRLDRQGKEVLTVAEFQGFGTWALFDDQPRMMTAIVVEDANLLRIGSDAFYELLSDHDEITPAIFKAAVERMKTLQMREIESAQREFREVQKEILRVFA